MALVSGVNIPDNKRVEISLTRIYGIGSYQAKDIAEKAGLLGNPRVSELSGGDLSRIREIIDREKRVEGDLKREVNMNVRRLIEIGSYRGLRHRRGLPVRGQRTHTNARTRKAPKRGTVAGKRKAAKK